MYEWNKRKATDEQIVNAIAEYHDKHGYAPTFKDVMSATGIKSSSTMHHHLNKIRDKGAIDYVDGEPRTLKVTSSQQSKIDTVMERIEELKVCEYDRFSEGYNEALKEVLVICEGSVTE